MKAERVVHVDGQPVALLDSDLTLLDAARRAGRSVPALCHDARVPSGGHCRSCLVRIGGRAVPSCTTPVQAGMELVTDDEVLRAYRHDLAELVRSEVAPGPTVDALLAELGPATGRYPALDRPGRTDASHPYLRLDLSRCITCRLCVRVCAEVQGRFVYSAEGRGATTHITWGPGTFATTACVSCGACASLCPTGAITDVDRQTAPTALDRTVRTTCAYCGVGCQLAVHVAGDRVVAIDGAASPVNHEHLCVKGRYAHGFVTHPERLRGPLIRRNGLLEPASWDEALALVARELLARGDRAALLSSSRCTNEENYLAQKWFRVALQSNNVDCCARVCHGPSAVGMRRSFGTGAATNTLADLERADCLLVAGSNATEAHPVIGARLVQATLCGAKLIVIDPRLTELARLADCHLRLRPGTNIALLNSLAAVIVEEDLTNAAFLAERAEGLERYREFIVAYRPEQTELITGVPAALVRLAARLYATAARPMQVHGLGVTEHVQGSEGVMLLCNLSLLVGALGREGVGTNPLRGQNNVQGAADMGCEPSFLPGYRPVSDPAARAAVAAVWGREPPPQPGLTLPRIYDAIRSGSITGLFVLGEDVVQTDPDARRVQETLASLEFLVVQELFLSETAKLAHVVLPGASFLEKDGTFTNGERRVQRVRQAVPVVGDARADWRILAELLERSGVPAPYASPADVFDELTQVTPMLAGASYARLEGDGLQWPVPTPAHPGTAVLHREQFPRGRGLLATVDYVPSPALTEAERDGKLLLVTGRALEHYNSGSMTRRTANARLLPHDAVALHPVDAQERSLVEGDAVIVESRFGEAHGVAHCTNSVSPGTVFMTFHFPESGTNRVTSDVVDPLSDCPEYKVTAVDVRRSP